MTLDANTSWRAPSTRGIPVKPQWRCRCRTNMIRPLLLLAALLSSALAKSRCEEKLEECESRSLKRPVCGSDDKTYPSRCHLLRAKCAGNPDLSVVWRGPCNERRPCWNKKKSDESESGFSVKCLSDGTYAPVQCHNSTGYCWCVSPSGAPIPNTSMRHRRPKCHRGKLKKLKNPRGHRRRKACGKMEKIKFINNLVRKCNVDLCRHEDAMEGSRCKYDDDEKLQHKGVEWKFDTLDRNSDKNLTSDEYQEFQKLVRKAVTPQRCSRSFVGICDTNKDGTITFDEWKTVLVKKPVVKKHKPKKKPPIDDGGDFGGDRDLPGIQESVTLLYSQGTPIEESQPEKKEEPEGSDCLTDRRNVLEEQTEVDFELFLPECTIDGRYQKVQCYKSTGYCWCVNEDTGKPIPGTSRKDLNPNCDALQLPLRPMKGCPDHKKKIFLKELKEFFIKQLPKGTDVNNPENNEKFAVATFQVIDANKNKFLEKKEMKPFKTLLTSFSQQVKRCSKKFPKYCDVNHDRKISLTEWVNCMDSERSGVGMTVSPSPQRKGPNPLETILKPDDDD